MSNTPKSDSSRAKVQALRESGWRGPIDQDGNAVEDLDAWTAANRPGP